MITGYGRWALSLSAQILVPMVFMMGLPPLNAERPRARRNSLYPRRSRLFRDRDGADVLTAGERPALDGERILARIRRLSQGDRRVHRPRADLAEVYGAGIRQQAALSEQLQAARALLLYHPRRTKERVRLAATIGVELDAFDALVAAISDLPRLRAAANAANAPAAARGPVARRRARFAAAEPRPARA